MPSIVSFVLYAIVLYLSWSAFMLLKNLIAAKRSTIPYIIIPWDQNSFVWMVVSVPLRPWLRKNLPKWIWDRLSLAIYGFEFTEKVRPFTQYASKQGDDQSYVIVTPGRFEMSTRDPEMAMEILKRPNDFPQVDLTALFMERFGPNVLTTDGEVWSRQRKIITSVINERISKAVFRESIRHTEGLIDEVLTDGSATDTKVSAAETNGLFNMMKRITILVLANTGMGSQTDWRDKETARPGFRMTFIESVQTVLNAITGPIILPMWFLSSYPSFLPGHHFLKQLSYAVQEYPIHTWDMFDQERKRIDASGGMARSNIMSQLLHHLDHAGDEKQNTKSLTKEEVMGNLFIITGAGFDTTANTLSYALALVARWPKWQTWMSEEIDAIMPESGTDPEYAAIFPKAIRVLACMHETLRLYPPLIHVAKRTKTKQTIKTSRGTYVFPAGASVYVHNVGLHLDPKLWRNLNLAEGETASDTDEWLFRPSRWIKETPSGPNMFQPPRGHFLPWSAGPRVCPGQKMAQVEFTAVFLKLFHKHRIEAVPQKIGSEAKLETRAEVERRLDERLDDSTPVLTLQMNDVYDVQENDPKGLRLRLSKRM